MIPITDPVATISEQGSDGSAIITINLDAAYNNPFLKDGFAREQIDRAGWANYPLSVIDGSTDTTRCKNAPQLIGDHTIGDNESCTQDTVEDIQQWFSNGLPSSGPVTVAYHICQPPNAVVSMGFLNDSGGQDPGTWTDVTCVNGVCEGAVQVPNDNRQSLTLRINLVGESSNLMLAPINRAPSEAACGEFQNLPGNVVAGKTFSVDFKACPDTADDIAFFRAQIVDGNGGGIIGDVVRCGYASVQDQCRFTFTVPSSYHSDTETTNATIKIINTADPQNVSIVKEASVVITSVAGPDPCKDAGDENSDAYKKCHAQDLCATDRNIDFTSKEAEDCAAKRYCESKKSDGFVYLLSFNKSCQNLTSFVTTALNYIMLFAAFIAAFMFIRGMYGIITSRGNPASVAEARETLTQAIIGLVVLAIAFVMINFLGGLFSIPEWGINLTPFILPAGQ
jgi:hypothetical protein